MSSDSKCTGFLSLPELVIRNLLSFLSYNTLKGLRLVSSTTKNWIDLYSKFLEKSQIQIDSRTKLDQLFSIPKLYKNFYFSHESFQTFKNFPIFIKIYGQQIEHLKLRSHSSRPLEINFLSHCPSLKTLEFFGTWPITSLSSSSSDSLSQVFQNVRNLTLIISCEIWRPEDFEKFGSFLQQFQTLETLRIRVFYYYYHQLVLWQIVSYFALRSPRFRDLILPQESFLDPENIILNQDFKKYPLIAKFCKITHEVEFDFRGIENDYSFDSIEEGFLSRITSLGTSYLSNTVTFPFHELSALKEIKIHMSSFSYPESFFLNTVVSESDEEIAFSKLKSIYVQIPTDFYLEQLENIEEILTFTNNQVDMVELELPYENEIVCSSVFDDKTDYVMKFLESLHGTVGHLSFVNWFSTLWIKSFENVTRLDFKEVGLRDWHFIGKDGKNSPPSFLRLKKLNHLSIINISDNETTVAVLTDHVFEKVFSQMRLERFYLHGPTSKLTKTAFKFLAEGPFQSTIEDFPYPWIFVEEHKRWKAHTSERVYSPEEFNQFKQSSFKFCQ